MMYKVHGGHYKDFTFSELEVPFEFGPFQTYQQAYDAWKKHMWINVDDGQYRLSISEIVPPAKNQTLTREYTDNGVWVHRHPNRFGEVRAYKPAKEQGYWILCSDPKEQLVTGIQMHEQVQEWAGDHSYVFDQVPTYER